MDGLIEGQPTIIYVNKTKNILLYVGHRDRIDVPFFERKKLLWKPQLLWEA